MRSAERVVLVVDDDLDVREALTDLLEDRGFQVMSAANGREALSLLRGLKDAPSVILLDLMMPIMDGYGFLEEHGRIRHWRPSLSRSSPPATASTSTE